MSFISKLVTFLVLQDFTGFASTIYTEFEIIFLSTLFIVFDRCPICHRILFFDKCTNFSVIDHQS